VNFQVMFFIYLLQSESSGTFYIGYTDNLERRVEEHNSGENRSTKHGCPWKLLYYEACLNQHDALCREKYLKTNQGYRLIQTRIKEYLYSRRS